MVSDFISDSFIQPLKFLKKGHDIILVNVSDIREFEIPQIDLVIVDLYPFEKTVASGASNQDIIEKIDIGGISLIRAAVLRIRSDS